MKSSLAISLHDLVATCVRVCVCEYLVVGIANLEKLGRRVT